ncbi:MAG: AAA family ATPase [Phycisphaerales bacterium]|nr:AAA family ATPase [Phycisphaerales bacterium]
MARVIAMLNQKGGVGKTTSAVNLAAAFAAHGHRTCLIDLDPQAHMTLHVGLDGDSIDCTVYDLLVDPQRSIEDAIVKVDERLDAIVAETDLAAAETELADQSGRQDILARKFVAIADQYDVVMIDCPPSLGLLTLNALAMADEVFVPMQAHFLALQGVGKLLETVGLVCQSVNPELEVTGVVLCMHEKQTNLAREVVDDLDTFFTESRESNVPWRHCRVLQPPIRRNIKLAEAPSFGQTIFQYDPTCRGAEDYTALAEDVIARWQHGPESQSPPATVDAATEAPVDVDSEPTEISGAS